MHRSALVRIGLILGAALWFTARGGAADTGFQPIFNGRDLTGWEGDPRFWSVTAGTIRGETTLGAMTTRNTFLLWRGEVLRDFDLQLKVRIRNGNSGVQYRSQDLGGFVVSGYQAEIDNSPGKAGFLYHEKGRKHLALVGQKIEIDETQAPKVVGSLATRDELIARGYYKAKEWNDYRIVARGPHLQHYLNGIQVVDVLDQDPKGRSLEGILALQIHVGPPMLVEFKDILIKRL
jgi:hypothetical protein